MKVRAMITDVIMCNVMIVVTMIKTATTGLANILRIFSLNIL